LTYCNAGHPPGLVLRGGEVTELTNSNMVLGVEPEENFSQSVMQLQTGDVLLLYMAPYYSDLIESETSLRLVSEERYHNMYRFTP